jgi:hypothetical protein
VLVGLRELHLRAFAGNSASAFDARWRQGQEIPIGVAVARRKQNDEPRHGLSA